MFNGRMPSKKKKKKNMKRKLQKEILSAKPWPLEEEGILSGSVGR